MPLLPCSSGEASCWCTCTSRLGAVCSTKSSQTSSPRHNWPACTYTKCIKSLFVPAHPHLCCSLAQQFSEELLATAGSVVDPAQLADSLVILDEGEHATAQNELASLRDDSARRACYIRNCSRFAAREAPLAGDARGPQLDKSARHIATRLHVHIMPAEPVHGDGGAAQQGTGMDTAATGAADSGGAAGGVVVKGSLGGALIQEWHGETIDAKRDILKPFAVSSTHTRVIKVNTDPFFNQVLLRRRVAWLFGTVDDNSAEVTVCAWYEPPQYGFTNRMLLLPDPHSPAVQAVADQMGLQLVGWCITAPFRAADEPLTGPEVIKIAGLQAQHPYFTTLVFQSERLPEELVQSYASDGKEAAAGAAAGAGAVVQGSSYAGRTVTVQSMQAYQLQPQIVQLVGEGKLRYRADRPDENNGSPYILFCTAPKMAVNPDTDKFEPTHKIHVAYAAAPVAIIGMTAVEAPLPVPWFPADNRADTFGAPVRITEQLYKSKAQQEFLNHQGQTTALQLMSDFNFLTYAAKQSMQLYGQEAWEKATEEFAALHTAAASGGEQPVLKTRFRELPKTGVPEAWFTPEEVLSMARWVGACDEAAAEAMAPKLWRLLALGWRCPHCYLKGQVNKLDQADTLVSHLKRAHPVDDSTPIVANPLSAAYAHCAMEREDFSTNLERDMRQHHLATKLGIKSQDGGRGAGGYDSEDEHEAELRAAFRFGGRPTIPFRGTRRPPQISRTFGSGPSPFDRSGGGGVTRDQRYAGTGSQDAEQAMLEQAMAASLATQQPTATPSDGGGELAAHTALVDEAAAHLQPAASSDASAGGGLSRAAAAVSGAMAASAHSLSETTSSVAGSVLRAASDFASGFTAAAGGGRRAPAPAPAGDSAAAAMRRQRNIQQQSQTNAGSAPSATAAQAAFTTPLDRPEGIPDEVWEEHLTAMAIEQSAGASGGSDGDPADIDDDYVVLDHSGMPDFDGGGQFQG